MLPFAAALYVACRLAYVLFAAFSLRIQSLRTGQDNRFGSERRYFRFRRRVTVLQNLDGFSFGLLCFASRDTIPAGSDPAVVIALGVILLVTGVGMKAWAVRCLGPGSYSWRDFFVPPEEFETCRSGPYRFISDPMYTLGYVHMYGVALLFFSWLGLAASLFAQATMLLLSEFVEKPHIQRLTARPTAPELVQAEP